MKNLKEQQAKDIYKVNNELANKVSFEDLADCEGRVIDKVTELIKEWASKFQTKEEITKRFSLMNRKLRDFLEGGR